MESLRTTVENRVRNIFYDSNKECDRVKSPVPTFARPVLSKAGEYNRFDPPASQERIAIR